MLRKVSHVMMGVLGLTLASMGGPTAVAQVEAKPGTAEKAGGTLDNVGRKIKGGVTSAAEGVRDGFSRTKENVHNMGIESRIYGRLHWDKALTNALIQLEVQSGGVAVLKGSVADLAAKSKAESLAADTVGVTKVVNQLAIAPATPTTTPERVPARP